MSSMSFFERASSLLFGGDGGAAAAASPAPWYNSSYAMVGLGVAAAVVLLYLVPLAWQYLSAPAHLVKVDGKHAFITGGSSGIGKALAIEFHRRGANVTIAARNPAKLALAKAEIEAVEGGGKVLAVSMDTTDAGAVKDAVDEAEGELGGVSVPSRARRSGAERNDRRTDRRVLGRKV